MIIFPAVDIKGGRAVRLRRGRADDVTVFAEDPVEAALGWQEQGAEWLHLVDLDGAFEGLPANRDLAARICRSLRIPVQLGGGIRTAEQARSYLDAGVARLIIGTMALEDRELFAGLCREFPDRIGVSLDTENGRLKSRGWVADAGLTLEEAIPSLEQAGASFIIHTDISRDGMGSGVNREALTQVCQLASVPVIAAGGVATLRDIEDLYPLARAGRLAGVISGRALYEGSLKLPEARAWLAAMH